MNDKPRYSRISDILELLVLMQANALGVTIQDIMSKFNISRRTAERMRDSVLNIFPQIDEIETDMREKHWGFTGGYLSNLVNFTSDELANLEKLKQLHKQNNPSSSELTNSVITKLKALNKNNKLEIENEIEILLQSEGFAVKQMPKNKVPIEYMDILRKAFKNNLKIMANYKEKERKLIPLGIIYGEKAFLIAFEDKKELVPRNYILHKFHDLKLIDEFFDKPNFDLKSYSQKAFGVYQGEIYNVKLNFKKEFSEEVLAYNFHPTQKMKQEADGSVIVKFKASGEYEILWHLFKWGDSVKILAPKKLKQLYKEMLTKVLENQK